MSNPTRFTNLALTKIGGNLLDNIEDDPRAQLLYDQSLAMMMRDHAWNFAESDPVDLAILPPVAPYPGELKNCFDLPGDFGRVNRLEVDRFPVDETDYKASGSKIWSVHARLTLTYGIKTPLPSIWPADFVEAFTSLLASKLARTVLQSPEESKLWRDEYDGTDLPRAKKNDARDSPGSFRKNSQTPAQNSPLVNARRGSRSLPRNSGVVLDDPASSQGSAPDLDGIFNEGF